MYKLYHTSTLIGTLVSRTNNGVHSYCCSLFCFVFVQWFSSVPTGDALKVLSSEEKQPEWRNGRWQNCIWGCLLLQSHQGGFLGTAAWLAGFHINTSPAPFHLGPLQSNWGEKGYHLDILLYISKGVWLALYSKRNAAVFWPGLVMHVNIDCVIVHDAFQSWHVPPYLWVLKKGYTKHFQYKSQQWLWMNTEWMNFIILNSLVKETSLWKASKIRAVLSHSMKLTMASFMFSCSVLSLNYSN